MTLKLRTDVRLGPVLPEYAENMYAWMSTPEVRENLGIRNEPSLERTREWLQKASLDPSIRPFAILLGEEHAGNVVFDSIDTYLGTGRLSVYVGDAALRSSGIGLTGMYFAIRQMFTETDLHKIWLTVHVRNHRAINSYIKLGFSLEGILRDEFLLRGERLAAFYMGVLRSDFNQLNVQWK